jgi:hypothetical protein
MPSNMLRASFTQRSAPGSQHSSAASEHSGAGQHRCSAYGSPETRIVVMSALRKITVSLVFGTSLALSSTGAQERPGVEVGPDIRLPDADVLARAGSRLGCRLNRSVDITSTLLVTNLSDERVRRGSLVAWKVNVPGMKVEGESALPGRLDPGETATLQYVLPNDLPSQVDLHGPTGQIVASGASVSGRGGRARAGFEHPQEGMTPCRE